MINRFKPQPRTNPPIQKLNHRNTPISFQIPNNRNHILNTIDFNQRSSPLFLRRQFQTSLNNNSRNSLHPRIIRQFRSSLTMQIARTINNLNPLHPTTSLTIFNRPTPNSISSNHSPNRSNRMAQRINREFQTFPRNISLQIIKNHPRPNLNRHPLLIKITNHNQLRQIQNNIQPILRNSTTHQTSPSPTRNNPIIRNNSLHNLTNRPRQNNIQSPTPEPRSISLISLH